jgi:hypothetical protein
MSYADLKREKVMLGLFKKKTEQEKLQERYRRLLEDAYKLSHRDRRASDLKYAEAEELRGRLEMN